MIALIHVFYTIVNLTSDADSRQSNVCNVITVCVKKETKYARALIESCEMESDELLKDPN